MKIPFLTNHKRLKILEGSVAKLEEHIARIEYGNLFNVNNSIHKSDFIFDFVLNHPTYNGNRRSATEYYFKTGDESAKNLVKIKHEVGLIGQVDIFEFASGYGCVTRHLSKYPDEFNVTSCDIHDEAVKFIQDNIGVSSTGSVHDPKLFHTQKKYDIVFALSFFSHLPEYSWGEWLEALYRSVAIDRYLIFTTHGLVSHKKLMGNIVLNQSGFNFQPISEQHDLNNSDYGTTITAPSFVRKQIERLDGAKIELFNAGFWWSHQDLWVIKKTA